MAGFNTDLKISILICSVRKADLEIVTKNIEATVGCAHEIISFDNSSAGLSIFEVYNLLKAKAQGEYLCFVHEDVEFVTPNWGTCIVNAFQDQELGLLGLAGSTYKSSIPASWSIDRQYSYSYIIQSNKTRTLQKEVFVNFSKENEDIQVVTIDGVFMVLRGELSALISFDKSVSGFHAYDADLCLAVLDLGFKVKVSNRILLQHHSEGFIDQKWFKNHIDITSKWKKNLPILSVEGAYTSTAIDEIDNNLFNEFIHNHKKYGLSNMVLLKNLMKITNKHNKNRIVKYLKYRVYKFFAFK